MHLRSLSQSRLALGSDVVLTLVTDAADADVDKIFVNLWHQVYLFERRFSRFLPMSELTSLNRAGGVKFKVTAEFKDLLICAKSIGLKTNGLYNPFITPALQRAGYVQSAVPGYENDKQIDYTDRLVVGVEKIEIGEDWAQIPYKTALDLGGCGKGYLADELGRFLKKQPKIVGFWLSLGGDILTYGYDENGRRMSVDIQSAVTINYTTDWVIDCSGDDYAVATSGTFRRSSQVSALAWHHIIDPLTLVSAKTDIKLATVCARTAFEADVLASCAVILGSKKAIPLLKQNGVKAAFLQCIDADGNCFEKKFGANIHKKVDYKPREMFARA